MTGDIERCSHCGMTREEVLQSNECGCAYCYEAFVWDIRASLRNNNEVPEHVGRKPEQIVEFEEEGEVQYKNLDEPQKVNTESYIVEKEISVSENTEDNKQNDVIVKKKELSRQLQEAIDEEDFERAAILRDKLKEITGE